MLNGVRVGLRFVRRVLRRNVLVSVLAVLTLGLGIGISTALLGIVRSVLLEPLPYPESERMVYLWESYPPGGYDQLTVSGADFLDFDEQVAALDQMAAYAFGELTVNGGTEPVTVEFLMITSEFFSLLGLQPQVGRFFDDGDERNERGPVVIIGNRLWQDRFSADPEIVGQTIRLDDQAFQVAGVMPPEFQGPPPFTLGNQTYSPDGRVQILLPLNKEDLALDRERRNYFIVGHLADSASPEQATEQLEAVSQRLSELYPEINPAGLSAYVTPLYEQAVERVRPTLWVFLVAAVLVLLIACSNVASLLLAKMVDRGREMAMRAALGAGPGRLVRQLIAEGAVLSLLAGIVGALFAVWIIGILPKLGLAWLTRIEEIHVDATIFGVALLLAVLTSLLLGLAPAVHGSHPNLVAQLNDTGTKTSGSGKLRLQKLFVMLQIGFALTLLTVAGLVIKSFWKLQQVDLGFELQDQATVAVVFPKQGEYDAARIRNLCDEILERSRALPEVKQAGITSGLPLKGMLDGIRFAIVGREPGTDDELDVASMLRVTPGFLQAIGMSLQRGRTFDEGDRAEAGPVALINEKMARLYWPDGDPLGQQLELGAEQKIQASIVGVVGDVRLTSLERDAGPAIFVPLHQWPDVRRMVVVARTSQSGLGVLPKLGRIIASVDPTLQSKLSTLDQTVEQAMAQRRVNMLFLSAVAGAAILLGGLGVFGVVWYSIVQRRKELGIRIAVGAGQGRIMAMILGFGLRLVVPGLLLGLIGAFVLGRLVSSLLFGVSAYDVQIFFLVSLAMLLVTMFSTYVPALLVVPKYPWATLRNE